MRKSCVAPTSPECDIGIPSPSPTSLFWDIESVRKIPSNSVFHEQTKHILVDCHFVPQKFDQGLSLLVFSRRSNSLFFFITKSQMNKRHDYYVRKLMMSIIDSKGGRWSRKEVYTKRGKSIMLVGVKKGRVIIELHYEINQVIVEKIVNQLFHHNIVKYHHNCVV